MKNTTVTYDKDDLLFIEGQLESQMDKLDRDGLTNEQINSLSWKVRELAEYYEYYISLIEES